MIRIAFLALIALATAQAQIAVRVQLPDATLDVADGGSIPFVATGLARPVTANLTVTNRGTQAATVNFVQISGSADFALSGVPETPAALASGQVMGARGDTALASAAAGAAWCDIAGWLSGGASRAGGGVGARSSSGRASIRSAGAAS